MNWMRYYEYITITCQYGHTYAHTSWSCIIKQNQKNKENFSLTKCVDAKHEGAFLNSTFEASIHDYRLF